MKISYCNINIIQGKVKRIYSFSIPTVIKCHKLTHLKKPKFVVLEFWRS